MNEAGDSDSQYPSRKWNCGGWFAGAVGCCAWMVIVGCLLVTEGQIFVAAVPLTCAFVTMMAAVLIWKCRYRMPFFSGLLSFIAVTAITTLTAWLSISEFANDRSLAKMNWPTSSSGPSYVLFALPLLGRWWMLLQRERPVPIREHLPIKDAG